MKIFFTLLLCLFTILIFSQRGGDLTKTVPSYFDYDSSTEVATLRWTLDPNATSYEIYANALVGFRALTLLGTVAGDVDNIVIDNFTKGGAQEYIILKKTNNSVVGFGGISIGIEVPATHFRGRCLVLIEKSLVSPLSVEIEQYRLDVLGDGWLMDTLHIDNSMLPPEVKSRIIDWHQGNYEFDQSLFLLGNIPVPYSGRMGPDGHANHIGAWPADIYYGELNGNWTDNIVNDVSGSRDATKNIPGDGKFDQNLIPGAVELQVGRADFSRLPAFSDNEIELTRKYLNKNHAFRIKLVDFPRRAIIENNFGGGEGFAQSGFNNFTTMFGPDNVAYGNYDEVLKTDSYLCAYAAGGGSYQSASGIGSTSDLYAANDLNAVFVMNFGSYFGDWDNNNNFLRAALASGSILTNAWAGRPNWHIFHMSLGKHIGYSTLLTQYNGLYQGGFGFRNTHVALMGDPTLRLHSVAPITNLQIVENIDNLEVTWDASPDASQGYAIYRKKASEDQFILLEEFYQDLRWVDECLDAETEYIYTIKTMKLEESASGSYYNTSVGLMISGSVEEGQEIKAQFTNLVTYEIVTLSNTSIGADGYLWDFGDGNTSNLETPMHSYADEGEYEICLTIMSNKCGSDKYCETITTISSLPEIEISIQAILCYGDVTVVEIKLNQGDPLSTIEWNDGSQDLLRDDMLAGDYSFSIITTTGVVRDSSFSITEPTQITTDISTLPTTGNDGVVIVNVTGGTPPYSLDFGDSVVDTISFEAGTHSLRITDANGCVITRTFEIELIESNDENLLYSLSIYPNPVFSSLNIISSVRIQSIEITDLVGRKINKIGFNRTGEEQLVLDVKKLASGNYYLKITTEFGSTTRTFNKQ